MSLRPLWPMICQVVLDWNGTLLDDCPLADDVREYRNFLVHDVEDEPGEDIVRFTVREAKKHLCAYIACLDAAWR